MLIQLALGLVRNPAPAHRWRRIMVPLTAFIFMGLLLAAASILLLVQRETNREAQRTALLASAPVGTDLFIYPTFDRWEGTQFAAVWIEPTSDASPILPPGMATFPQPGQTVVSPALDQLASRDPGLSARYPNRLVLESEGIRSGDELFAYLPVPEDRTIAESRQTMRAGAFGRSANPEGTTSLGVSSPTPLAPLGGALFGFLVLPGLIILAIGLAAASEVRDHRFDVMRWLGVPQKTLASLAILETLFLTIPSFVVAAVLWGLFASRLTQVPLVGQSVIRGDLGIPWWWSAILIGFALVVTVFLTLAVTTILGRDGSVRPSLEQLTPSPLRVAPIALAFCMFLIAEVVRTPIGATLNLWGMIFSVLGAPLILPSVLRMVGSELGQMESVLASIAGRGIEWAPVRAARPYAAIAGLVVLSLVGIGYIALMRSYVSEPLNNLGPHIISVAWQDARAEDLLRLEEELGAGLVAPIDADQGVITLGATCHDLAYYLSDVACSPDAPFALTDEASAAIAIQTRNYASNIKLASKESMKLTGRVLIFDNDVDLAILDNHVRTTAMQLLPAPNVTSQQDFILRESPLVAWVVAGLVIALVALTIASLLSMTDRLIATRENRRHLLVLGLSPNRLKVLEGGLVAIPYSVVLLLSFTMGFFILWLMSQRGGFAIPWATIGTLLGMALLVGASGTIAIVLFGTQGTSESPRSRLE